MGESGETLITVVVVSHNDVAHLPRAVRSAQAQTHRNLEILVIDDHSDDDTPEFAAQVCQEDARVAYHRREVNSGAAGAPRNDGMRLARGEFVMFLDSDDEFLPTACELLLREAQQTGADLVAGLGIRVHVNGSRPDAPWYGWLYERRRHVADIEEFPQLIRDTVSWNKLYRTSMLRRAGARFPEGIQFQDIPFTAQVFAAADGISVIPDPVTRWNVYPAEQRKTVTAQRDSPRSIRDRLSALSLAQPCYDRCGAAVRTEQDDTILKHHLHLYLLDALHAPDEWVADMLAQVRPLIAAVDASAFDRMKIVRRTLYAAAYSGDIEAVRLAARGLKANALSGRIHRVGERAIWSPGALEERPSHDDRALLLSDLTGRPYLETPAERVRRAHFVTHWRVTRHGLLVSGESSDPYGLIARGEGVQHLRLRNECGTSRMIRETETAELPHGAVAWQATLPLPGPGRATREETWRFTMKTVFHDGSARFEPLRFDVPQPLRVRGGTLLGRLLGDSWTLAGTPEEAGILTTQMRPVGRAARRLALRTIL